MPLSHGAASVDENAALIAEHLEAAGDLRAAYGWHMRSGAWSQSRDIAAALVSWERAARIADVLPADDADRLAMRIAPRTLSCANGWRIHKPIAGKRFEELQDLCAAAGDKASVAIAMTGLLSEHLINGRLAEASRLASEHMVLIESIGDPTLTVGLALGPIAVKVLTGEIAQALRWSRMVIDLAEGDRARGGYIRWISVGVGIRAALHGPLGARPRRLARGLQPCRRDGPRCRPDITGSGHRLHLQQCDRLWCHCRRRRCTTRH